MCSTASERSLQPLLRLPATGAALLAAWLTVRNPITAASAAFFTPLVYVSALASSALVLLALGLYAVHVRRHVPEPGRRVVVAGAAAAGGVVAAWASAIWAQQIAMESMLGHPIP